MPRLECCAWLDRYPTGGAGAATFNRFAATNSSFQAASDRGIPLVERFASSRHSGSPACHR